MSFEAKAAYDNDALYLEGYLYYMALNQPKRGLALIQLAARRGHRPSQVWLVSNGHAAVDTQREADSAIDINVRSK